MMSHLDTEKYVTQSKRWPENGNHILAHFDESSVIVYQAYNPSIAQYAVTNNRFGGEHFSFSRMSWIKTNFLWMMYRSGWASKENQERILAVKISKEGFDEILRRAYTAKLQKTEGLSKDDIEVRLQWDPDHSPTFEKQARRAIQLGMKGETLKKYATEWIIRISDITDFVIQQRDLIETDELITPVEEIYEIADDNLSKRLSVSRVTS